MACVGFSIYGSIPFEIIVGFFVFLTNTFTSIYTEFFFLVIWNISLLWSTCSNMRYEPVDSRTDRIWRRSSTCHFNELTFMRCTHPDYHNKTYAQRENEMQTGSDIEAANSQYWIDLICFVLLFGKLCILFDFYIFNCSISPLQLVYQASSRLHRETTNVCSAPLTAEPPMREQLTVSVATVTTALTPTLHRCPVQVCVHKPPWQHIHEYQNISAPAAFWCPKIT